MSNRNPSGTGILIFGLLLIGIAVLAFISLTVYAPFLLLIAWLYVRGKSPPPFHELIPSPSEKQRLQTILLNEEHLQAELSEMEGQIRINLDGSYDQRFKLSQYAGKRRDDYEALRQEKEGIYDRVKSAIASYKRVRAARKAYPTVLKLYLPTFGVAFLLTPQVYSISIVQNLLFKIAPVSDSFYGAASVAGFVSYLTFAAVYMHHWSKIQENLDRRGVKEDIWDENSKESAAGMAPGRPATATETWFEILGVSATASAAEINAAWKEKMKRNHPDVLGDVDEAFLTLATERAKKFNEARRDGLATAR